MTIMSGIPIEAVVLNNIFVDFKDGYDSPLLDCVFCSAVYPLHSQAELQTQAEREAALAATRNVLIDALCKLGTARREEVIRYVLRNEYLVRETMNEVDDLPVKPMRWMSFWKPMRWRHREGMKQLWNEGAGR